MKSDCLVVIPARGGSKGFPGKNLAPLVGKPLMAWTIEAAREVFEAERVWVSSDDEEIQEVACQWGATVPFRRPAELATDTATAVDVCLHALEVARQRWGRSPGSLLLLQPTSPGRTVEDIRAALALAEERQCVAVVSVSRPGQHPMLAKTLDAEGRLVNLFPEAKNLRRQDLPEIVMPNGAIYWIRSATLEREQTFYPDGVVAYPMPPERSVDIDTEADLVLAEFYQTKSANSS